MKYKDIINKSRLWYKLTTGHLSFPERQERAEHAFREEYAEYCDAFLKYSINRGAGHREELIDAIFDTVFTYINLKESVYLGSLESHPLIQSLKHTAEDIVRVNFIDIFRVGLKSNFDKFYSDRGSAEIDADVWRTERGVECSVVTSSHDDTTVYYLQSDPDHQVDNNGKIYFPNKILKPVAWREPVWEDVKRW